LPIVAQRFIYKNVRKPAKIQASASKLLHSVVLKLTI